MSKRRKVHKSKSVRGSVTGSVPGSSNSGTAVAAAISHGSSLIDDAFSVQSEMLEFIKAKQMVVEPVGPVVAPEAEIEAPPKITLVELKQQADHPGLIEWHDTNAKHPLFLAKLKCFPGAVQVPVTWQGRDFKSKYSRPQPYRLPKNIYDTGILQQRVFEDSEEAIQQLAKDRVQPKLGRLDLDLDKFRDAFRHQKRPHLSKYGQVYHEGLELEPDLHQFRPGVLSPRLREALGMKDDTPPWTAAMAKHGFPAYGKVRDAKVEHRHWGE